MIKDVKVTIPHSNSHIPILNGKLYPIWYPYDFQDYIPILTSQWFRFRWVFGLFFFANPSGFPVFMRQPLSRRWFCQAVKKQNWYVSNVSTYLYCILIYIYIFMHIIISIPTKYLVYIILAFCSLLTWLKVWFFFFESADLASRWRWPFRFGSCSLSKVAPGKYVWMAWPKDPFWDP